MQLRVWSVLCVGVWLAPPWAQAASQWTAVTSSISYTVVHKFHKVEGVSTQNAIAAKLTDNSLQIMGRAAVDTFLSGNTNRDAHVMEVIEGHQYPFVTVRAVAKEAVAPTPGKDTDFPVDAEIELHGVKTHPKMQAYLHWVDDLHVAATFTIADSIEAHNIERPKLLFVPVDDLLEISGKLVMKRAP